MIKSEHNTQTLMCQEVPSSPHGSEDEKADFIEEILNMSADLFAVLFY
jgi:hypothetical protein